MSYVKSKQDSFPWSELKEIGDHFFVPHFVQLNMAVYINRQVDGRRYAGRTVTLAGVRGTLVILVEGQGLKPQRVYNPYELDLDAITQEIPF